MKGWKPRNEAPQDGSHIIVMHSDFSGCVIIKWAVSHEVTHGCPEWCDVEDGCIFNGEFEYWTHPSPGYYRDLYLYLLNKGVKQ